MEPVCPFETFDRTKRRYNPENSFVSTFACIYIVFSTEMTVIYVIFHCVQFYHWVGLVSNLFINHFITLYSSCVVLTQVDVMTSPNIAHSNLPYSQCTTFSHDSTANATLLCCENHREIKNGSEAFL